MLLALRDALVDVKRSVGKGVVKSVVKILDLIAQYPDITRERLAREVGLSVRGVEKNLDLLKVGFLSSRKVPPAAVMKCYDWATEMRDRGVCVMGGFQSPLERCWPCRSRRARRASTRFG